MRVRKVHLSASSLYLTHPGSILRSRGAELLVLSSRFTSQLRKAQNTQQEVCLKDSSCGCEPANLPPGGFWVKKKVVVWPWGGGK